MTRKRLLIVHDDATLVGRIKGALAGEGDGFEVATAISGPRAIGIASSSKPDVVVVDAELVGMDGYELTRQLKGDPALSDCQVVILTLAPDEASAMKARQAGACAHLPANGDIGVLVQKIRTLAVRSNGGDGHASMAEKDAGNGGAPASSPAASPVASPPAEGLRGAHDDVPADYGLMRPVAAGEGDSVKPTTTAGGMNQASPMAATPPAGYGEPQTSASLTGESRAARAVGLAGAVGSDDVPHIDDLLRLMIERGGSDLHVTVGSPPGIRIRGEIEPVEGARMLSPRDTMEMILTLLSEEQRKRFETELELDLAYSIPGLSRFRANVFQQRNSMGAVFRVVPLKIPTIDELKLPKVCRYLAERPRGLVVVTGPTGCGKSTTLAAMIDHINVTRKVHIVTLEDPIEFVHKNKAAYVNQREVGEDTKSFAAALRRVLRQDPDVILVGEMRDLETISAAITAAETGHLVLATLHTTGGPETVDRMIDVFPPHQQQQVRMQLSTTLEGVLSQVLMRSTDGRTRVLAMEIMLGVPAISNLIREGKTHQMATIIQGGAQFGMQTLDQHLKTLLQGGRITFEEAISKAANPRELAQMMGRNL